MIHVNINGTEYEVFNRWEELSVDQLLKTSDPRSEIALCIPDLPKDLIYKARTDQLLPIYTAISFLNEVGLYPLDPDTKAIEEESYDEFVQVSQVINELSRKRADGTDVAINPYQRALKAALVYYPKETNTVKLLALGASIVLQFHTFLENYEILATGTGGEGSDWLDKLQTLGPWGTVFALSGRDVTKMDAIFKLPALQVYTAILYNFMEGEHQKEVIKRRQSVPQQNELSKRSKRKSRS